MGTAARAPVAHRRGPHGERRARRAAGGQARGPHRSVHPRRAGGSAGEARGHRRRRPRAHAGSRAHRRRERSRERRVTWDIGETVTVPPERIAALREIVELHGARWSTSSVHFHATFDPEDKASGAVRFVTSRFGEDATAARSRWAFVGDSGNDRSCFAAFDVTFGVSNVSRALGAIAVPPRFVASAPMGEGFAEISRALLRCKMA